MNHRIELEPWTNTDTLVAVAAGAAVVLALAGVCVLGYVLWGLR